MISLWHKHNGSENAKQHKDKEKEKYKHNGSVDALNTSIEVLSHVQNR